MCNENGEKEMNLHSNSQYPLFKYLSEEFAGSFYQNELTCLNRMLILYHNRLSFSIDDDTSGFLDEFAQYLEKPVTYWWIPAPKRVHINALRTRIAFVLKNNPQIFRNLLSRPDYSSSEAKQQTIKDIHQWLPTLNEETDMTIDVKDWQRDLSARFSQFLHEAKQAKEKKISRKPAFEHFYQILKGKDQAEKQGKFGRLVDILLREQWITGSEKPEIYQFRNSGTGGRLQLAALYYTLNKQGHIDRQLPAPQVAGLFNSWLSYDISRESFVKAFQTEQLDTFNCSPNRPRHKYVTECRLLLRDL
ncbi:hypothetical protein LZD49_04825 [Dyadobacter sp. CY261]|uniref:hypothetical protein n=1 Tax=Dyadobacter sp. CY261 TaxID=2907203 RepID=UPI001F1DAAD9|nr:hypothetical protein [Dyadobacter sp. CY261]MCF0069784.1 hypothetical protein [Dyadobacter sp. CY261]